MASIEAPILVTGASGKTGRRIIERLTSAGHAVRAGSRSGTPRFDWDDHSTWAPALDGVRVVYVAYQPDLAAPGAVEIMRAFITAAKAEGVQHMVLLSGRGEVEAEEAEQALQSSGLNWTVLRASWFAQNFSESFFHDAVMAGELALPVGPIAEPFIDIDDIAEIAAEALTGTRHHNRLYEVTGPRGLTFAQAATLIGEATGRPIRFQSVPAEAYRAGLIETGVPVEAADLVGYLFRTILDGRNANPADGVQQALGRPAARFEDYVARTAASGVWHGPAA